MIHATDKIFEGLVNISDLVRANFDERRNGRFPPFDNFPFGCCLDASILLGQKILTDLNLPSTVISGTFDLCEDIHSHAWLNCSGFDIDITADQFCSGRNRIEFAREHFLSKEIQIISCRPSSEYADEIEASLILSSVWLELSKLEV